jgi:hypothetical protein
VRTLSKGLFIVAGLLAQPPATGSAVLNPLYHDEDPRLVMVREFFLKYNSPVHYLAGEFVAAAEENNLDWRLLPAIAVVESGGGREYSRNNIFGWDSGRTGFPSISEGIHTVASRLANSKLYREKDLWGILRTYNTSTEYAPRILALMKAVGPAEIPAGGRLN